MKKILFCVLGLLGLSFALSLGAPLVNAEPYGWSPDVNKSTTEAPAVCSGEKPQAPILYQPNHPVLPQPKGPGQIRLQWVRVSGATGYVIYYGLSPKNYIYSVQLPDSSTDYTVGHLANRVYYFAIQAKKGCVGGNLSMEWGARPNGGGFLTAALNAVPLQRTITPAKARVVTPAAPVVPVTPTAPVVQPQVQQPLPVAPAPVVPAPAPKIGFMQSLGNFFGGLFK